MEGNEYSRAVRKHWRLVIACLLASLGIGALLVQRTDRLYRTSVTMFVTTQGEESNTANAYAGALFTQQRMTSYVDLVRAPLLIGRVADRLSLPATEERRLSAAITASSDPQTTLLRVTVTDTSPARAQRIANAVGAELSAVANDLERPAGGGPAAVRMTLAEEARLPTEPITPRPEADLPVAALLGLLIGSGAAVLSERLDDPVTGPDEVVAATGAAVLGVIPDDPKAGRWPLISSTPSSGRAEAFRNLRTTLRYVDVSGPARSIAVTSAERGEGRTTTAVNLAFAMAQAGLRVAVVDCDLRHPTLAGRLDLDETVGLTDLLARRRELDDVIQSSSVLGLDVIAGGAVPPNPAELLASTALRETVRALEDRYDVVVLDTPALLDVTDAALVAAVASGALLVARHGHTSRDRLARSRQALDAVSARLFGSVVDRAPRRGRMAVSYGYGGDYDEVPAAPKARPSLLGQTLGTVASQGALLVLGAASSVMAARFLGATGRGLLTAASLGPGLVASLLALGFEVSNVYYVGGRKVTPEKAFGTSTVLATLLTLPGVAAYLAVVATIRVTLLRGVSWPLVVTGSLLIPLLLVTRYAVGIAQGQRRIALVNVSTVSGTFTTVVLYAVLLGGLGHGPLAALVAIVAGAAVTAVVVTAGLLRGIGRPRWDRKYAGRGLRFGVKGYVGNVVTMLTYRIDVFIVTAILGLAAAGHYAVAYTTTELLWQVPNAIAMILFPRVAQSQDESAAVTARLCRLTLTGTAMLAVAGGLMAPSGIPFVFSREFGPAVPALLWLLPGIVLFGAAKLLSAYLTGNGRPELPSRAAVVTLPVVVGLNLLLVRPFGIAGAAAASTIAYSFGALLLAGMFVRHSGLPWSSLWRLRWADIVAVAGSLRQLVRSRRRAV